MPTFTVTKDVGGTAKPVGALYVEPELQIIDASSGTTLAESGLNAAFLADLLSACLAHERCGVHLYRSVAGRTNREDLRERYAAFGAETEEHVRILEDLVSGAGGNPSYVSPAARATEKAGAGLVESTYLLGGSIDEPTQELAMLEAVMLAEAKDHGNWELLAQLAAQMAAGAVRDGFSAAATRVLVQEEEHYGWAAETRAALLFALATQGAAVEEAEVEEGTKSVVDLTRDELYARAQELDIEGRSTMNKDQLTQAVAEAKGISE
jgi:rubrerythrin